MWELNDIQLTHFGGGGVVGLLVNNLLAWQCCSVTL
jgi:hypothetical protein